MTDESGSGSVRLVLAGLTAGLILIIGEVALNGWLLGLEWELVLDELGVGNVTPVGGAAFFLSTLLLGFLLVFLYEGLSRRLGRRPRTAVVAGLVIWVTVFLYTSVWLGIVGVFPSRLLLLGTIWGAGESILAGLAAFRVYR